MGTHMKLFTIFASAVLANQEKRQVPDQFAGYLSLAENFLGNGQYQSIYNSVLSELATNTYWQDWVPTVPTDITALSNLISQLPTGFESELESVSEFLATADRTGDSSITRATSSTTTSSSTTSSSSDDSSSAAAPMLDAYFTSLIASFLGLSAGMVMMF